MNSNETIRKSARAQWPVLYEKEKALIQKTIGHIIVGIEHIGSTAVPDLGSKPIIDILVAVNHLSDAEKCITPLEGIDYEYVPEYEESIPDRRYFHNGDPPKEQHYHLRMVELTSDFWKKHLLFRDHLRTHPKIAQKYHKLKKRLALKYGSDREGYTEAKTSFIKFILAKATHKHKK